MTEETREKARKREYEKRKAKDKKAGEKKKKYWFIILPENCGLPLSVGSFIVSK
jgi:hypothetical protein